MGENVINDIIMPKINRIILHVQHMRRNVSKNARITLHAIKRRSTMNKIIYAIHEMSKNILHAMNN